MTRLSPPPGESISGILLTGASSEIGRILAARLYARPDLKLLLTSNMNAVPDLGDTEGRVLARVGLDLTDPASPSQLLDLSSSHFQGPFALVHSVGDYWDHKSIVQCTPEQAADMVRRHYLTLYAVLHTHLPLMQALGGGRVLALSCTSVGFNHPDMAAFTSAKAALECLVKCTANEWADRGVSANAIALSTVATPTVMGKKPLAQEENYVTREELCVLIEDILFAASPYISGNIIRPLKHSETYYHRAYYDRNPPLSNGD